ncbi:hypothetical protein BAY59_24330 [Prauserella coralliicola]|nr:hypothetical protein BAY59_24330 [Prauserella coralliicola]
MPWRGADPDDPFPFPSLGWTLLEWWADFLPSPRDESEPLIFTNEQARSLIEWYALDPLTGRFVHRRGASRRSKGWGKSPREAAKGIAALAGPTRFDGWDANGDPVGRPLGIRGGDPKPWVQIAAVSEDQTDNTYSVIYELLNANDGKAADELGIDVGLTRCFLRDRPGKLEPVTAAAGSREGQPITDAILDETHLWTPRNGGVKLARTLRRNVAKMNGRTYETTNSFVPGEESVAEGTHKAVMSGSAGVYYDAVEAPLVKEDDSDETLKAALKVAYGDSWWVDLDRLVADIRDPETPWEDSCRFFFNWNVDDRQKAVAQKQWAGLAKPDVVVPAGTRIGLGFDGSISDDCTVLIGCAEIDGEPHEFEIEIWSRPKRAPKGWRIPRRDVQARVREVFSYYDVGLMLCDPAKWQTEIEGWAEEFGEERVVFFDTNQPIRMSRACDRFSTTLAEGAFSHDGSETFTRHVLAMHKRKVRVRDEDEDGRTKFVFVKGPEREKIDGGIGGVLALEAFSTMPEAEPEPELFAMWGSR